MSVLLDALKKAADEKKNAEHGIQSFDGATAETSLSDSEEQATEGLSLNLPLDSKAGSTDPVEDALPPEPDLPVFNLQDNDSESGTVLSSESSEVTEPLSVGLASSQIDTENSEVLNLQTPTDESSSSLELHSLIDSLDLGSETPSEGLKLEKANEPTLETALNIEQQTQPEVESITLSDVNDSSLALGSEDLGINTQPPEHNDSFAWSMDELPAYDAQDNKQPKHIDDVVPIEKNPILISGDNTPKKSTTKFTSPGLIVSLFVMLILIGIGFYGLFYYQEQNDSLERSMNQYNISKIQLTNKPREQQTTLTNDESFNSKSTEVNSNEAASTDKLHVDEKSVPTLVETDSKILVVDNKVDAVEEIKANNGIKTTSQTIKSQSKVVASSKYGASTTVKPKGTSGSNYTKLKQVAAKPKPVIVKTNPEKGLMREAYAAYESRDYVLAKEKFNEVIALNPSNQSALLGLGGIAVANKNLVEAIGFYQRVLNIDANNLSAFEAIANLSGKIPLNDAWKKELFIMADNYPSSSTLQYAKGNVYVAENDWLKAQDSYFNALTLAPNNPDFMLNLAVSYDHLGKYRLAAQYYTQALGYAETKPVSFDVNQVRNRLISIKQFIVKGY